MAYYNTSAPDPNNKNTINSTSIDIRDFLLLKNLKPQYPMLGTTPAGGQKIGMPVLDTMGGSGSVLIPQYLPLQKWGITFKNTKNVNNNMFINIQDADTLTNIDDIPKGKNPDFPNVSWPFGMNPYPMYMTPDVTKYGIIGKTAEAEYLLKNTNINDFINDELNGLVPIQIIKSDKLKSPFWGTLDWPPSVKSYPRHMEPNVTKYGIVGKTKVANFLFAKNISNNLFMDKSPIANIPVDVDDIAKGTNPNWPTVKWPNGFFEYPKQSTPDIIKYGIVGKTKEANFLFANNISKNLFMDKSPTANTPISVDDILKGTNPDFPTTSWPYGLIEYPIGPTDDITKYGIIGKTEEANYRFKNTSKNLYLDADKQIDMAVFIDFNIQPITKQIKSYIDEYGDLNLGGSGLIQAADIVGSVLNGQGLGFAKGGVVTNYDIRASLVGRVLGATGIIHDTKLGIIGGQQLALALANNAGFNLQQDLYNVIVGPNTDYKITVPSSSTGRLLSNVTQILGFTIPTSYLDDSGSIFQSESGQVSNINRANAMLLNTGTGQFKALLKQVHSNIYGISPSGIDNPNTSHFRTGYAPAYKDNKGVVQVTYGGVYAYSTGDTMGDLLATNDNITYNLNNKSSDAIAGYGFKGPEQLEFIGFRSNPGYNHRQISDVTFSWGSEVEGVVNTDPDGNYVALGGDKKSLLVKTQQLFNSIGMKNLVTVKGEMGLDSTQIMTTNAGGISKGNAVIQPQHFTPQGYLSAHTASDRAEDVYCRVWTTIDRYDKVRQLVRHHGLWDSTNIPYRNSVEGSVLEEYGFVKIAPYITDKPTDPKKFMFSIENLAWSDNLHWLPEVERGPGDFVSNKRGRIMWFPPYNIQFSETSSVNWEATNFIGRGESIYTYNNTERSGNLSFSVIVDHPSYANAFRAEKGPDDHYINSFWAGCIDPNSEIGKNITVIDKNDMVVTENLNKPREVHVTPEPPVVKLKVFFPNDNSKINVDYENGFNRNNTPIDYSTNPNGAGQGLKGGSVADTTKKNVHGLTDTWTDGFNYGLNWSINHTSKLTPWTKIPGADAPYDVLNGFFDPYRDEILGKFLTETCKYCVVKIRGYASYQGYQKSNVELATNRGIATYNELYKSLKPYYTGINLTDDQINKRFQILKPIVNPASKGCPAQTKSNPNPGTDHLACKQDRYANISIHYDATLAAEEDKSTEQVFIPQKVSKRKKTTITNKYYNEQMYFEQLTDADPFVFDTFRQKIRYFHPAFHSTTPEGLNSRLTFLLQCTRQGPTFEQRNDSQTQDAIKNQGADNLAFGRPPVCILRIGDFYNTKIVIDNVSIDYEPLQWDLNPEGIGVQPMIANVNISFKFIGGSTLMSPIQKLQNALSFNYFANTQVYDVRADYFEKKDTPDPKSTWNYTIRNGVQDISQGQEITVEDLGIVSEVPEELQTASSEVATKQESAEPVGAQKPTYEITGLTCKYPVITSASGPAPYDKSWSIVFNITTKPVVDIDPETAAAMILTGSTYLIRVRDGNSNEVFSEPLNTSSLGKALVPSNEMPNFIVPVAQTNMGSGIVDSVGRENFILEILQNGDNIYMTDIKLK